MDTMVLLVVAQAATDILGVSKNAIERQVTSEIEETLLTLQHTYRETSSIYRTVTILPHAPQKPSQNDRTVVANDPKRRAHDIARDSHGIEEEIRAMVSSYMAPKDDEDQELAIGRLVC